MLQVPTLFWTDLYTVDLHGLSLKPCHFYCCRHAHFKITYPVFKIFIIVNKGVVLMSHTLPFA